MQSSTERPVIFAVEYLDLDVAAGVAVVLP
jgi:hypothetical protein